MPWLKGTRAGGTLAELIVALVLAAVVSALGAVALAGADRHARRTSASRADDRALREAAEILSAELRAAWGDSLRLRGDTAIDILAHVGISIACVVSGPTLVLPPSAAPDSLPFSVWRNVPERGDRLVAFDHVTAAWRWAGIDSVVARTDGAGCTPASGFITASDSALHRPVLVLRLDRDAPASVGAPVRVLRPVRWFLHRGTDKSWSLATRRCDPTGCSSAQPVTGPLASMPDSGLVFLRPDAATVEVRLRAPPSAEGRRARRTIAIGLRGRVAP